MSEPGCDRFAHDGAVALAVERGELDDAHVAACDDCRAALDGYRRLTAMLGEVVVEIAPPDGWEAGARRRIATRKAARRRQRRIAIGGATAAAIALAAVIALWWTRRPGPPQVAALDVSIAAGGGTMRAGSPRPGDVVRLDAHLGGAARGELRVYRVAVDGGLLLRCAPDDASAPAPAATRCRRDGDRITAELVVPAAGRYRAVLLRGDGAALGAAPTGSLDRDVADAEAAGARDPVRSDRRVLIRGERDQRASSRRTMSSRRARIARLTAAASSSAARVTAAGSSSDPAASAGPKVCTSVASACPAGVVGNVLS
jgi:hypothetical protein